MLRLRASLSRSVQPSFNGVQNVLLCGAGIDPTQKPPRSAAAKLTQRKQPAFGGCAATILAPRGGV
jgi:hypothetical protein